MRLVQYDRRDEIPADYQATAVKRLTHEYDDTLAALERAHARQEHSEVARLALELYVDAARLARAKEGYWCRGATYGQLRATADAVEDANLRQNHGGDE